MHKGPLEKPEKTRSKPSWNKGKLISSKPPLRNQGRLLDPDQASGGGARPGLGRVQSSHPQQAVRLRCGPPEG
jgi:hypothetical protein